MVSEAKKRGASAPQLKLTVKKQTRSVPRRDAPRAHIEILKSTFSTQSVSSFCCLYGYVHTAVKSDLNPIFSLPYL